MTKNAIFVYRGNNPLFGVMERELRGENIKTKIISQKEYKEMSYDVREGMIKDLSRTYGLVITDNTMGVKGSNICSLYDLMSDLMHEDWPEQVKKVADFIKEKGREPIIFPFAMSDHLGCYWHWKSGYEMDTRELETKLGQEKTEEIKNSYENGFCKKGFDKNPFSIPLSQKYGKDIYISKLLEGLTKIPALPFAEDWESPGFKVISDRGNIKYEGTIPEALGKMSHEDLSKIVLLCDHHLRGFSGKDVKGMGLDKVKVYPICRCCLSLDNEARVSYNGEMEKKGINVWKHEPAKGDYLPLADKVRRLITEMNK